VTKAEAPAALVATGTVPSVAAQVELAAAGWGDAVGKLPLAAGAPEGWMALAKAGVAALGPLQSGEMTVTDGALTVKGVALSPVEYGAMEAALAGLPEGAVTLDITTLDDGTPPAFSIDYTPFVGASVTGKLPPKMDLAMIAEALGLPSIEGSAVQGILGDPMEIGVFASLSRFLPDLERLKINMAPGTTEVVAEVGLAADMNAVQAGLAADLDPAIAVTVIQAAANGADGDERVNAATGEMQRYGGGYWLPIPEFTLDKATCQTETQKVLDGSTINFLTASDVLDDSAKSVLNDLASIMAQCAGVAGLRAIVGGHTDSSGDALMNLGLSQKRATAVRLALVDRGVPAAALKAIGFGAQQPIADNTTDEGKARNRRTSIDWVE
jgi:outer membrane protein OmpA-like peptidoglycan-associated protein